MRILILNSILFTADNNVIPKVISIKDTMIYNMCLGFKDLGHHITLIAAEEYRPIKTEEYDFEIIFIKSNLKSIFSPSVLPLQIKLYSFLSRNRAKYDIVLSSEIFSFPSLFASLILPTKTVIWHELTDHNNKFCKIPSKIWYHLVSPLFMRKVKIVIPRSYPALLFTKQFALNIASTFVDHGVNIDKFEKGKTKKNQFISISQLIPRKNVDKIIHIFSEFVKNNKYSEFILLIAGRGSSEYELKKIVQHLGLENQILFLGFLSQQKLNRYTSESYASLIHTRKDLNMVSIPESIVSGTPVVTNMKPALATFVASNYLGIACDDWGVNELIEIVENNKKYEINCENFRMHLSNKTSAQKIINLFLSEDN